MLDVLQFIFQDFWHWLGAVILISCIPVPFTDSGFKIRIGNNKNKENKDGK